MAVPMLPWSPQKRFRRHRPPSATSAPPAMTPGDLALVRGEVLAASLPPQPPSSLLFQPPPRVADDVPRLSGMWAPAPCWSDDLPWMRWINHQSIVPAAKASGQDGTVVSGGGSRASNGEAEIGANS